MIECLKAMPVQRERSFKTADGLPLWTINVDPVTATAVIQLHHDLYFDAMEISAMVSTLEMNLHNIRRRCASPVE